MTGEADEHDLLALADLDLIFDAWLRYVLGVRGVTGGVLSFISAAHIDHRVAIRLGGQALGEISGGDAGGVLSACAHRHAEEEDSEDHGCTPWTP
jgi:hypothetical protein